CRAAGPAPPAQRARPRPRRRRCPPVRRPPRRGSRVRSLRDGPGPARGLAPATPAPAWRVVGAGVRIGFGTVTVPGSIPAGALVPWIGLQRAPVLDVVHVLLRRGQPQHEEV